MKSTTPLRLRIFRFLSDRYYYRERPSHIAELILLGVIVILAAWPMFSLVDAFALIR